MPAAIRSFSILFVLCLFSAPASLSAAPKWDRDGVSIFEGVTNLSQIRGTPSSRGADMRARRSDCALTGTCKNRPAKTICRQNGPCIPASHAWSPDGPKADQPIKPGGFQPVQAPPPLAVPLPAPVGLLMSALAALLFLGRKHRRAPSH